MAAATLDQWSDGVSDSDWDWSDEEENDSPFDAAMRDHHQFIIRAVHLGLIDLASDRLPKSTWKNVLLHSAPCSVNWAPQKNQLGNNTPVHSTCVLVAAHYILTVTVHDVTAAPSSTHNAGGQSRSRPTVSEWTGSIQPQPSFL